MKTIKLIGLVLTFGMMLISANAQTSKFAALAVDRANGFYYGWSYDLPSLAEAEKTAMSECAKRGGKCSVILSFSGAGCGAYRTIKGISITPSRTRVEPKETVKFTLTFERIDDTMKSFHLFEGATASESGVTSWNFLNVEIK